jgi:hypothetical protein
MYKNLGLGLCFVVFTFAQSAASASTWTFASGGNRFTTVGTTYGNRVGFWQGDEHIQALAWADTAGGFETAYIRRFLNGLGVCNRDEGVINDCISGGVDHQVDNISQNDLVLLILDTAEAFDSLTIDPYGVWDRDISFWVGTVSPTVSLTGANFATLGTLGFGSQHNALSTPSESALTVSLGGLVGNAILISALRPADGSPDRFKIRSLVTSDATVVPVPAAAWLLVSALGTLAGLRRTR